VPFALATAGELLLAGDGYGMLRGFPATGAVKPLWERSFSDSERSGVRVVVPSPDGRLLLVATGPGPTDGVLDAGMGKVHLLAPQGDRPPQNLHQKEISSDPFTGAWHPSGAWFVVGTGSVPRVELLTVQGERFVQTSVLDAPPEQDSRRADPSASWAKLAHTAHTRIRGLVFGQDGQILYSVASSKAPSQPSEVRAWDVRDSASPDLMTTLSLTPGIRPCSVVRLDDPERLVLGDRKGRIFLVRWTH
jgi:WD40 repeat protein